MFNSTITISTCKKVVDNRVDQGMVEATLLDQNLQYNKEVNNKQQDSENIDLKYRYRPLWKIMISLFNYKCKIKTMFCGKVSFEQCFGSEAARIRIKKGRQDPDPHGKMRIRTVPEG